MPASIPLLENFAGQSHNYAESALSRHTALILFIAVIRNMAFEKLSFRKEIQTFKGTDAVIKVRPSPFQFHSFCETVRDLINAAGTVSRQGNRLAVSWGSFELDSGGVFARRHWKKRCSESCTW